MDKLVPLNMAALIAYLRGEKKLDLKKATLVAQDAMEKKLSIMTAIAARRFQGIPTGAGYMPRALEMTAKEMENIDRVASEILRRSILS